MGGFRSTLFALAAVALLSAAAAPPVAGTSGSIQPGDSSVSDGAGCTLNFVFDGVGGLAGRVFIGTAAHCVERVGANVSTGGFRDFGTVAYRGDDDVNALDFAFIEVKPEFVPFVDPRVKGHAGYPTGVATRSDTREGDLVQISGYGTGFGLTPPTQEKRQGVLTFHRASEYSLAGPIWWGDSGGPLVHVPTGKALGIVSRLCLGACTEKGPTVEGMIAAAAKDGFTVSLRTV